MESWECANTVPDVHANSACKSWSYLRSSQVNTYMRSLQSNPNFHCFIFALAVMPNNLIYSAQVCGIYISRLGQALGLPPRPETPQLDRRYDSALVLPSLSQEVRRIFHDICFNFVSPYLLFISTLVTINTHD